MSAKKAPCVDVRTDVHKDVRFEVLGELAGYNRYEALGRLHALWSWCVDRGLQDAPEDSDGYVVSDAVVRRFLGPNGITAILGDGCDEFALGERLEDGRIYLRGTSEYVTERRGRAAVASAGGTARAAATRDQAGRFVLETTNVQPETQQESSRPPAGEPAGNQPPPASSSSSSPSGSQNTHAPRAIPPAGYDHDSPGDRMRLATETYERIAAARDAIAADLGLGGVVPMPRKWGAAEPGGFRDLRERIRAEGNVAPQACDAVVDILTKQAREERDVEWLSDKAFTEGGWRTARNGGVRKRVGPQSARPAPRGAIGASGTHKNHGDFSKAAKEVL